MEHASASKMSPVMITGLTDQQELERESVLSYLSHKSLDSTLPLIQLQRDVGATCCDYTTLNIVTDNSATCDAMCHYGLNNGSV